MLPDILQCTGQPHSRNYWPRMWIVPLLRNAVLTELETHQYIQTPLRLLRGSLGLGEALFGRPQSLWGSVFPGQLACYYCSGNVTEKLVFAISYGCCAWEGGEKPFSVSWGGKLCFASYSQSASEHSHLFNYTKKVLKESMTRNKNPEIEGKI